MTPFTPTHSYEWFQQAEKLAEYLETERRGSANIVAWVDPDDPWKLHYNIGSKQPHTPDEEKEDVILAEIAPEHEQRDQNNQTDEQNNAASEQAEKGMQSALEEMMEEKGIDLSRIAVIPGKSSPNTEGTTKHSRDFLCEYPVPTGATELQMTCAEAQHLLDEGAQKVFVCLRAVVGNRGVSIYLYRGKNAAAS